MKTVILIRHGESETNLTKQFTGQLDASLTQLGRHQAELMARYIVEHYRIDQVYTSTLSRAKDTAQAIIEKINCPSKACESLCEINAGTWQGMTFDEIGTRFPDSYAVWRDNFAAARPDGGESCEELYNRVTKQFQNIIQNGKEESICIVTHATPIRMLESYIMGNALSYAQNIRWVPNASATVYRYDGNFHCEVRGYSDYLGDLKTNLPKSI